MTDLTADSAIEMLRKLDAEMTPGPWRKGIDDPNDGPTPCVFAGDAKDGPYIADCTWDGSGPQQNADAGGIAALRNALPALRRLIESQAATIKRLGEALATLPRTKDGVPISIGLRVVCPNGHDQTIMPYNRIGGSTYCVCGKCWSDGCQSDSGSGTHYELSQCTTAPLESPAEDER